MVELLSCPFCGEQPQVSKNDWATAIDCINDECPAAVTVASDAGQNAAERWNTRAAARAPSPSSAEVLALADRLRSKYENWALGKKGPLILVEAEKVFRALAATPAMPAPADAWQHIETAPRDGTPFLCFHPDDYFSSPTGIDLIWYEPSIKEYTMDGDNEVPFAGITHWMPLPLAPVHYGKTK
jgi:hypothetical protein